MFHINWPKQGIRTNIQEQVEEEQNNRKNRKKIRIEAKEKQKKNKNGHLQVCKLKTRFRLME